jgi:hypothetical protein
MSKVGSQSDMQRRCAGRPASALMAVRRGHRRFGLRGFRQPASRPVMDTKVAIRPLSFRGCGVTGRMMACIRRRRGGVCL